MSLAIAGGYYAELCAIPPIEQFFGPGGRAAAVLCNRDVEITLYCYLPSKEQVRAEFAAGSFGYKLATNECTECISFSYLHFLSVPEICPRPMSINAPIEFTAENILRYGFIEGDAIVHGKQVVYDPQDAMAPKHFGANGSTAEKLAFICNLSEAHLLTQKTDKNEIVESIIEQNKAEVVVLKCGGEGCFVWENGNFTQVDPHPTENVYKLGSGDVFTAEFSYGWIVLGMNPVEATKRASLQTAYYCKSPVLPVKKEVKSIDIPTLKAPVLLKDKKYDVYLAGPFFNLSQRWMIEEARNQLRGMGLKVFSPIHDVGEGNPKTIAKEDLAALHESGFVFACLTGFDPGTVFEIGYAYSIKIPTLAYGENLPERDLDMFIGTDCTIVEDFVSAIYRAAFWKNSNK